VTAFGHYCALGGAIAEHSPEGFIDGVPDAALERWAKWTGKRGRFAKAVRDVLQSPDGTYGDWLDSMGKLIERREKERARKLRGDSAETPRHDTGNSGATERNGTERDVTERNVSARSSLQESSNKRSGNAAPPANASADALPRAALELLDRFYPKPGRRRRDVEQQLRDTLNGGAKLDRHTRVRAGSAARLDAKCREVLTEVRDPDKAIRVLLLKLGDTSDGSAPGVAVAANDVDESHRAERTTAADLVEAYAYFDEHPTAAATLEAELRTEDLIADTRDTDPADVLAISRRIARTSIVLRHWKALRSPDPVDTADAEKRARASPGQKADPSAESP
jgi:hypothetical protein